MNNDQTVTEEDWNREQRAYIQHEIDRLEKVLEKERKKLARVSFEGVIRAGDGSPENPLRIGLEYDLMDCARAALVVANRGGNVNAIHFHWNEEVLFVYPNETIKGVALRHETFRRIYFPTEEEFARIH